MTWRGARDALALHLLDDRYPALHGLRVLAIFLVVQIHVNRPDLPAGLVDASRRMWFAMDLFFVLSGFLIGMILLRPRERGWRGLGRFYARRALRTLPYYAVVALIIVHRGLTPFELGSLYKTLLFLTNYPHDHGHLLAWGWSLSLEEHFYLLCPLLFLLLDAVSRRGRVALLAGLFLLAPVLRYLAVTPDGEHFFNHVYTPTHLRYDPLIAGLLLAHAERSHSARIRAWLASPWARLFCLALPVAIFVFIYRSFDLYSPPSLANYQLGAVCVGTLPSLAYACLILWAIHCDGAVTRWLGGGAMRALATLGYGVYLTHLPVAKTLHYRLDFLTGVGGWLVLLAGTIVGSLAAAWGLHAAVEKPALRLRDRIFQSYSRNAAAAAAPASAA